MQDEKLLEVSLEAIASRVQDLKESLQSFLAKLEHEQMNWPSFLDNFALLSGQVNTLTKLLKSEKTPLLRNLITLPLLVQQEPDPVVQKATEGRVQAFNHEVVPDYLRTKFDPEIEEKEQMLANKALQLSPQEAQRQISVMNELASALIDVITTAKEDWEGEQSSGSGQQSSINPDLNALVSAVTFGKGLRPAKVAKPRTSRDYKSDQARDQVTIGKAQSSVKTEMKGASASIAHPYSANRPRQ